MASARLQLRGRISGNNNSSSISRLMLLPRLMHPLLLPACRSQPQPRLQISQVGFSAVCATVTTVITIAIVMMPITLLLLPLLLMPWVLPISVLMTMTMLMLRLIVMWLLSVVTLPRPQSHQLRQTTSMRAACSYVATASAMHTVRSSSLSHALMRIPGTRLTAALPATQTRKSN